MRRSVRTLAFKENPDFENPADSNSDNIYAVTVRATDDVLHHEDRALTVKVTRPGRGRNGRAQHKGCGDRRDALTATLKDSDGGVAGCWDVHRHGVVSGTAWYAATALGSTARYQMKMLVDEADSNELHTSQR